MPFSTKVAADPFGSYRQALNDGTVSYSAGFPHYPRNFSRDTIIAGIIASSPDLLVSQLEVSADHQGEKYNSTTGERPGRIHHEFPGVTVYDKAKYSTYNACDTTALFLIAAEALSCLDEPMATDFIKLRKGNLERATQHILESTDENGIFWEYPPENNDGYALRVTYWKDSILPNVSGKIEPVYPVVFPLAQFMAARSLLSASRVLGEDYFAAAADRMYKKGIQKFIKPSGYTVYQDSEDRLVQTSSDELHALAYIPSQYAKSLPLDAISRRAEQLTTPFGFMCTPNNVSKSLIDTYHGDKVWAFEQAMIHYGATKFGLDQVAEVAASVAVHIGNGQELFAVRVDSQGDLSPTPEGNNRQLWSVAAGEYFASRSTLLTSQWL